MKHIIHTSIGAALFTGVLMISHFAAAQRVEATITTTTSEGTVSEFGPQAFVITTTSGTQPIRYISNGTTNYVDENGNPVAPGLVKSGLPVTVFYTKVGDTLVASKVLVKRSVVPLSLPNETAVTGTSSVGVISEFGPDRFIITSEGSPDPVRYSYSKTTTYADEYGQPVTVETVKSGVPVTVYYSKVGNTLVASKVIVRRATVIPAPVVEQKRTITTTTTTEK